MYPAISTTDHNLAGIFFWLVNLCNPVFGDRFDDHLETQPARIQARFVFVSRDKSHIETLIILSKYTKPKVTPGDPAQPGEVARQRLVDDLVGAPDFFCGAGNPKIWDACGEASTHYGWRIGGHAP
ncbi:MAG: hypothetical protein WCS31_10610 [Verrucomicrobiae bacterium]